MRNHAEWGVVSLVILTNFLIGGCSDTSDAQDVDDRVFSLNKFTPTAINLICNDDEFLEIAGLDSSNCKVSAKRYSRNCIDISSPMENLLAIDSNLNIESLEKFQSQPQAKQIQSLATLYGTCLQSYILRASLR